MVHWLITWWTFRVIIVWVLLRGLYAVTETLRQGLVTWSCDQSCCLASSCPNFVSSVAEGWSSCVLGFGSEGGLRKKDFEIQRETQQRNHRIKLGGFCLRCYLGTAEFYFISHSLMVFTRSFIQHIVAYLHKALPFPLTCLSASVPTQFFFVASGLRQSIGHVCHEAWRRRVEKRTISHRRQH